MKNILGILVLSFLLHACGSDSEQTMTVTGNVKGLKKGILYLQHIPDSTLVSIDSIQINGDGNFTFKTALESPELFYLYLNKKDNNDINDRITFFGEPGLITINTTWNRFDQHATIEGSETHLKFEEYRKTMTRFNAKNLEYLQRSYDTENPLDSIQLDSIQKLSAKNIKRGYAFALNFALNNVHSHIAPYIALNEVPDANIKYLDSINNSLLPEIAASKYGRELNAYLEKQRNK